MSTNNHPHALRVLDPSGNPILTGEVYVGSHPSARRVCATIAQFAGFDGHTLEVFVRGGWEPRKIIKSGKRYYTREVHPK